MKIIRDERDSTNWFEAVVQGRWVIAKIYDEPSTYGVNDCRVSKLSVSKNGKRDREKNFFDQMAYNYDRGLDFHNETSLPQDLLDKILTDLNSLPRSHND